MKFSRKKMNFLLICLQFFKKLVFSKSPTWFTSVIYILKKFFDFCSSFKFEDTASSPVLDLPKI